MAELPESFLEKWERELGELDRFEAAGQTETVDESFGRLIGTYEGDEGYRTRLYEEGLVLLPENRRIPYRHVLNVELGPVAVRKLPSELTMTLSEGGAAVFRGIGAHGENGKFGDAYALSSFIRHMSNSWRRRAAEDGSGAGT